MRRVYLPATLTGLAGAHAEGALTAPVAGHAVTPAMREWYTEGDLEEYEYVALTEAAEASLRLLALEPDAPRRRVVIAADVPDAAVRDGAFRAGTTADQSGARCRSAVQITQDVPVTAIASVHVDDEAAEKVVADAIAALAAADAGDEDARFALDEAEAAELLWYDVSEIADLI